MSEQKLEVFNVLNFLNSGYELEDILKEGQFGTFSSADECIKYLVDEGYLEGEFVPAGSGSSENLTADEVSQNYTVTQLKDILREKGLKVSGKKEELIERVLPVLNGEYVSNSSKSLDDFKSNDLTLTDKAHEFLEQNRWIDLYMFALVAFRFEDYEIYVNSSDEDDFNTALKFCDEIISRALVANQFLIFIDALSAKAHVYAYAGDYESFLDYDLQCFILRLNPIVMDPQSYAKYRVIDYPNIINLKNVIEKLDMGSLKKRFNRIWDKSNIRSVTVPKKSCYKVLKKALNGADIEELNSDLKQRYFDKKFKI